jgi:putative ABC transport system permease protein
MPRSAAPVRVSGFLAVRAITRGNRGVIALTVVLMGLIYAELLFMPALIQGATDRIQSELRSNLSSNIVVTPASDLTIPQPTSLVETARSTPGVAAATATILTGTQISHGSRTSSWSVFGIDPISYGKTFATPQDMIEGSFLDPGASDEIVLGVGIAGSGRTSTATYRSSLRDVHVGDSVTVTLLDGRTHDFTVRGIYSSGLEQADVRAFISAATTTELIPALDGRASAIYIRTDRVGDEQAVIDQLRAARPDVHYDAWQDLASEIKDLTGSFNLIKSIFNAVSLFVAAITIFIVTYVDLANRRRTIGIERAIGISGGSIATSYVMKAIVFASVGVLFGAAIIFGIAAPIVRAHPFQFPIGPVTLSITGSELRRDAVVLVLVAIIGALVPAWRAVRIQILDAIWS